MTHEPEKKPAPIELGPNVVLPKLIPPLFRQSDAGKFVSVRPCGNEYGDKTYLGIYMGDMPQLEMAVKDRPEHGDKALYITRRDFMGNPAIYVPDLNQIIYGAESWWGVIKSPNELRQITNADIDNVWYVQALKSLTPSESKASANE